MMPIDLDSALAALQPCRPTLDAQCVKLPLRAPFRISDHVFHEVETVVVRLEADGHAGQGEAAGVFYLGDEPAEMLRTLAEARGWIEQGLDHAAITDRLPPGGARNALDCALWDLQARRAGRPVWRLLGMEPPRPLLTTFTVGKAAPAAVAAGALAYADARAIKIKLGGDGEDEDRIRAVRAARRDVWLGVDANRGLTPDRLERLLPALADAEVQLVEQPFPVGEDAQLAGFDLPCPVAADESIQTLADLDRLARFYQVVNIKLDKCGGLTEALRMAERARVLGLSVMVGNMIGSSLAMGPAYLVGQYCAVVDLDGPIFLQTDPSPSVRYRDGFVDCSEAVWGGGAAIEQPTSGPSSCSI
ncbi:dipeptide epimerase [Sphingomonas histidinilytica]|uniref:Dipeptide epimerase n=1 Tax=Rhizorhabdus histidinilytica TaxID=439228 RepID=A0A1T5GNS3_9SPHN|nr:dipeptide epimerase [Rhizorhabdus histidinilytica]MBO9380339.1 dipeptide epimerase [Rhizorhabdus histidinilytica]SKC09998.1 L-alanine-DL-glutamate epimerase [Rhizorhabdus histidinilytica]